LLASALSGAACGSPQPDTYTVTRDSTTWTERYPQPSLADTALRDGPAVAPEPPPPPEPEPEKRDEKCDPNYDPCVAIDSDVDCAGGRGNGPSYVQGPVHVIGRDVYGLDRDGDGIGCDR